MSELENIDRFPWWRNEGPRKTSTEAREWDSEKERDAFDAISEHEVKKLEHVVPGKLRESSRTYVSRTGASTEDLNWVCKTPSGMRTTDGSSHVIVSAHIYVIIRESRITIITRKYVYSSNLLSRGEYMLLCLEDAKA